MTDTSNNNNKQVLTIGIFAHANAGKTTITEHLLYHTNIISSIGRVDSGNTVTDSMLVEKERGITVRASLVSFDLDQKTIQLIDTPGHIDFSAEVERAINVLDGAVLVISGVEGIEPQTYTIWRALQQKGIPVIIFINKMDRMGADYLKVLNDLRMKINKNVIPLVYVEQMENKELRYLQPKNDEQVEIISNFDDETLELYINNPQKITTEWVQNKITYLAKKSLIFPVIGGSALKDEGIVNLLHCISKYIPTTRKDYENDFSAFIYLVRWINNQKYMYAKILSGKLSIRDYINIDDESTEKLKGLYIIEGAELKPVDTAECGEIVMLTGINVQSGQLIGDQGHASKYVNFVKPLLNMQILPENKNQLIELVDSLKILNEEDPYLNVKSDKLTGNIYVSLMGEVQGQIIQNMLSERFGISAILQNPIVVHKEFPTVIGRGKATYTTVSGVEIEVAPLAQGSGLIYKSRLATDYLLKKYQNQTERLIRYFAKQGIFGWEVIDAEISLVGGRFDSMGSDPSHFNISVPLALIRAFKNCKMKILEPIFSYSLVIPQESLNLVVKSLSSKNSIFEIEKEEKEQITLKGVVALSNILNFPTELMKITGGRGVFSSQLYKYELSPNQSISNNYYGPDPRNEVYFVMNEMKGSLVALDKEYTKIKKESRSKFKRLQEEKEKRTKKTAIN